MSKLNEVLNAISKENVLVSNSGQRKENIYRKDILADAMTDRDKKTMRRKLRNTLDSFLSSYLQYEKENNKSAIEKLFKTFSTYYKQVYVLNDFSLQSICSANTEQNKKDGLQKMMNKFSSLNNPKKETTKKKTSTKKEKAEKEKDAETVIVTA